MWNKWKNISALRKCLMIGEIKGLVVFTIKKIYFYWKVKLVYEASGQEHLKRLSYSTAFWT